MLLCRKDIWILIILWLFFSTLFTLFPALDILVSSHFFDQTLGIFPLKNMSLIKHLNNFGHWLMVPLTLWPFAMILTRSPPPFSVKQAFLYIVFYAFCAIILIEYGVKEIWLRPRPEQIILFGGTQPFLEVFQSLPKGNFHSFVSGHTSVWFGLICIGYTVFPQHRQFWIITSLLLGCCMAFLRICVGAHFLSDTIFAGLFVCSACIILDVIVQAFQNRKKTTPSSPCTLS
jgi:lipid A 4'-phosphatase